MTIKQLNKKGFSISEMLMVVLILSLIVVIIGGGVVVVKNAYTKITLKAEAQTLLSTTITAVTDEFRYADDVHSEGGHWVFESATEHQDIYLTNDTSNLDRGIIKAADATNTAGLISKKTMTSGLTTTINDYVYNPTQKTFTATITVLDKDGQTQVAQEIIVKTINNTRE